MAKEQPKVEPQEEATKYPVAELIAAGPGVFGVKPELMAGALYGLTESTKEEAEKRLQVFKNKEVR